MADKKNKEDKSFEKKVSKKDVKETKESFKKDVKKEVKKPRKQPKPKKIEKVEKKYSIDELCSIFSISKFEAKSHYLVNKINENEKITVKQFRNFFR